MFSFSFSFLQAAKPLSSSICLRLFAFALIVNRYYEVLHSDNWEADTIPTNSVPTDAILTICRQYDPVHLYHAWHI